MYSPRFRYTPTVLSNLGTVERLYGSITAEKLILSLSFKLTRENAILATHYSTSIEGNPLSMAEVTNIVLGDSIPATKSELEVKNYFEALNRISVLAKSKKPLSIDLVLELHGLCMKSMENKTPGKLRDSMVIVGHRGNKGLVVKHNPPAHTSLDITKLLTDVFSYINSNTDILPLIVSGILHHEVAYIHPFYDGNGRVTRLLTAYYLMCHGYDVTKYFILDDYYDIDRIQYSDKLHSADTGDKTEWLEYYLEGIAHSLKAALNRINTAMSTHVESVKGDKRAIVTPREEDVLQVIIDLKSIRTLDVVKHLGVSRQQAASLLRNLVDKGIIKKFGITKSSYYELVKKDD